MRNQTKFRNNVSKLNYFSRDLAPRQISSCTHKCIWGSPSRTSAATAASPSPTAPTSHSTWGSISASSPTDVKYVSASSPSSHISSSTSGLTLATSPTSAGYQVTTLSTVGKYWLYFMSLDWSPAIKYSLSGKRKYLHWPTFILDKTKKESMIVFLRYQPMHANCDDLDHQSTSKWLEVCFLSQVHQLFTPNKISVSPSQ